MKQEDCRSKRIAEQVGHDAVPVKKVPWEEQQLMKKVKRLQSENEKLKVQLDDMVDCFVETKEALEKEKRVTDFLKKAISDLKTLPIECEICAVQYGDSGMTVPRVLRKSANATHKIMILFLSYSACGHTICTECAGNIIQNKMIRCPFDRKVYKFNNKTIENLPKNFSLINQ